MVIEAVLQHDIRLEPGDTLSLIAKGQYYNIEIDREIAAQVGDRVVLGITCDGRQGDWHIIRKPEEWN